MSGDGHDLGGDGADWLLAQLANGTPPKRSDQPEAPVDPDAAAPAQAARLVPPAAQAPAAPPVGQRSAAPRREEVLDWFSEAPAQAEVETPAEVETRALPVIGGPAPQMPVAPAPGASAPVAPSVPTAAPPSAPPAAPAAPSWTPPFAVEPPRPPATPPVYLTQVEPPVGSSVPTPGPTPVPGSAPSPSASPLPPVGPVVPAPTTPAPPGPVTPTAPFALTWGDEPLESEDAIRAAFRSLAEPSPLPSSEAAAHEPAAPPNATAPSQPVPPTPPLPIAPESAAASAVDPGAPVDPASPFAGYSAPPVARQSFTPVSSPIPTHPTAPANAPAGWDERRSPAEAPAAQYDDELWAALHEAEPTAPPSVPAPAPTPPRSQTDRFAAFAAEATDPFAALTAATALPVQPPAQPPVPPSALPPVQASAPVPTPEPASNPVPELRSAAPAPASEPESSAGFPFLEVRGAADVARSTPVGAPAREAGAFNTTPFPAFASGRNRGDDDPTRQPPAPVDDLLASLGGGGGGAAGRRDAVPPAQQGASHGGGSTPPTGPVPSGLDALGLGFDDESDDESHDDGADDAPTADDRDEASTGIRGRFFGRAGGGGAWNPDPVPGEADDSSISREMSETGYFWNLTPDPNAEDPKDRPEALATSFLAATGGADDADPVAEAPAFNSEGPTADAGESGEEPQPEPEVPAAWEFGRDVAPPTNELSESDDSATDAATMMFPAVNTPTAIVPQRDASSGDVPGDDPLAALFGGAASGPGVGGAYAPSTGTGSAPRREAEQPFGAFASTPPGPGGAQGSGGAGGPGGGRGGGNPGAGSTKGGNRTVRTLIWVAGGLAVVLVIAGLYFFGTQLGGDDGGAEQATGGASASASETPVAAPTAPQPAGVHAWDTLFGGECLDPFVDAWAGEFTVVDCAAPHAAQLVYRGTLPGDAAAPYPGEAELAAQMPILCQAAGVFEPTLVAGIGDLQVQGAFPLEAQWGEGQRTYFCFANRAGGEPLTGPINGPGPAA